METKYLYCCIYQSHSTRAGELLSTKRKVICHLQRKIKLPFSLIPFLTVPSCCSYRKPCCSKTIMNLKTSHASEICFHNYYNILHSTNKAPLSPLSTCFLLHFSGPVLGAQQSIEIFSINKYRRTGHQQCQRALLFGSVKRLQQLGEPLNDHSDHILAGKGSSCLRKKRKRFN